MLLVEKNTIKKKLADENNTTELNNKEDSREYKVELICNSAIYAKDSKLDYLLIFYYLVF